jgi:hypothetical protein
LISLVETLLVRILKAVEVGAKLGEMCRKHGIGELAASVWRSDRRWSAVA